MSKEVDLNSGLGPDDASFEKGWLKALRRFGFVFPTTREELESFEKELAKEKVELPSHLQDPFEVLRRGESVSLNSMGDYSNKSIEENLARAAREGGEIPDDVAERMKKDRSSAEESTDNAE